MSAAVEISVIVPVYNEVESLPVLWEELGAVLRAIETPSEVIFVDDGSTDGSTEILRDIVKRVPGTRLRRLATNTGLTAAFHAGFEAARGRILATLDSDLQNDPRDIATLLAHLEGADAAVGWRPRRHDPWLKRVSSRVANAVRNAVTGDRVRDSACSLRVMRRECAAAIPPFSGMHRFVPTLLRLAGFRVVEVPVHHRPRRFGRSKYGVRNRVWVAFEDLLAVRWMMRRRLAYEVAEESGTEPVG